MDLSIGLPEVRSLLDTIFQFLFGFPAPQQAVIIVYIAIVISLISAAGYLLLQFIFLLKEFWIQIVRPVFYDKHIQSVVADHKDFADHILGELKYINDKADWRDRRFAQLEAEVEVTDEWKRRWLIGGFRRTNTNREYLLSKALQRSHQTRILLEGDPGSGKSIALRYIAAQMAGKAARSRSLNTVIPLYINLKGIARSVGSAHVDSDTVRQYVLQFLNRSNNRDVAHYLDTYFDEGVRQGKWFFLFDSFDEIAEVLSSVETDNVILEYSEAIRGFLGGMNRCRGVVASRQYRGPKELRWTKMRILPLRDGQRKQLIYKSLPPQQAEIAWTKLAEVTGQIGEMAKNPMFLSLLCDHVQRTNQFPTHSHAVFESYLDDRFERDSARLQTRFNLTASDVRYAAEVTAFTMTADTTLGLAPERSQLLEAISRQGFTLPNASTCLDALEYIKLARQDEQSGTNTRQHFTFSHRRFQEYFATCVVIRDIDRVSDTELLVNARWRETTVILAQTQPPSRITHLLIAVEKMLPDSPPSKELSELSKLQRASIWSRFVLEKVTLPIDWAYRLEHVIGILQDGFQSHPDDLPITLRQKAGNYLLAMFVLGLKVYKKRALELAGFLDTLTLQVMIELTFFRHGAYLGNVAFQLASRLPTLTVNSAVGIRKSLIRILRTSGYHERRHIIQAHLERLPDASDLLSIYRFVSASNYINGLIVTSCLGVILASVGAVPLHTFAFVLISTFVLSTQYHRYPQLARIYRMVFDPLQQFSYFSVYSFIYMILYGLALFPFVILVWYSAKVSGVALIAIALLWKSLSFVALPYIKRMPIIVWFFAPIYIPIVILFDKERRSLLITRRKVVILATSLLSGALYLVLVSMLTRQGRDALAVIVVALFSVAVVAETLTSFLAWIKWVRWKTSNRDNEVLSSEFLLLVAKNHPIFIERLVRYVRTKRLLPANIQSAKDVEDLAFLFENRNTTGKQVAISSFCQKWDTVLKDSRISVSTFLSKLQRVPNFSDEISALLEELRENMPHQQTPQYPELR